MRKFVYLTCLISLIFITSCSETYLDDGDSANLKVTQSDNDGLSLLATSYPNIYAIKKSSTGTNTTEVHILNGSNGYQSFSLQTGTCLHETDTNFAFCLEDYDGDSIQDIFAIKKSSTGTNSTEIHVLSGSNNFQSFILQTGTALHETGDNFEFLAGDYDSDGYVLFKK